MPIKLITREEAEALGIPNSTTVIESVDSDLAGVATWLRVIDAVRQLAITTSLGSVH